MNWATAKELFKWDIGTKASSTVWWQYSWCQHYRNVIAGIDKQAQEQQRCRAQKEHFELLMAFDSQLDSKPWFRERAYDINVQPLLVELRVAVCVSLCVCMHDDAKQNSMEAVICTCARDWGVQVSIRTESARKCSRLTAHHAPQSLWNDPPRSAKHSGNF